MGAKHVMILRNHGTLAIGKTVGECFLRLYFLERACQAQIMALSAGENVNNPPQGAPETAAEQGAIGVTCRADDRATRDALAPILDAPTAFAILRPKRMSFAIATASSSSLNLITDSTGPNTSSCASADRGSTSARSGPRRPRAPLRPAPAA